VANIMFETCMTGLAFVLVFCNYFHED